MTDERSGGQLPVVIVRTNREWWVVLYPALICKRVLIKALTERGDKDFLFATQETCKLINTFTEVPRITVKRLSSVNVCLLSSCNPFSVKSF